MLKEHEINEGLANCYGTDKWYQFNAMFPKLVITDGVKFLAESADCYWLLDVIGSHQPEALKTPALRDFQLWEVEVAEDKSCVVTCKTDSGKKFKIKQEIGYTDFPLKNLKLYCNAGGPQGTRVILLTSEY